MEVRTTPTPIKSQKYRVSWQYTPEILKSHKVTKPAFSVWPSPERGGGGGRWSGPPPTTPVKSQKYRVSWQYTSESPKIYKVIKPAFKAWPSSARQRNAILIAFCWRADDDPLLLIFSSCLPHLKKMDSF